MNNVRFNTVSTLFKMKFEREPVSQIKLPQKKLKMMTNEDEIGEVLSGEPSSTDNEQSNPTVIKVGHSMVTRAPVKTGEDPTIGRNDPCPCGSGKKFKKCHGA